MFHRVPNLVPRARTIRDPFNGVFRTPLIENAWALGARLSCARSFHTFLFTLRKERVPRGVYYTTQAHSPVFVLPNLKRVAKPKQKKLPQNCLDKLKLFCEPGGGETPEGPTVLFPDFPIIHKCANEDPWLKRNKIRCHCKMNILEFS